MKRRTEPTRTQHLPFLVTSLLALAAASAASSTAGCSEPRPEPPLHEHVVCDGASSSVPCDAASRTAAFDAWAQEAQHRPGSTFEVLVSGAERDSSRRLALVCVPPSWGRNVSQAKAAFLREARARVAATAWPATDRVALPQTCTPGHEDSTMAHSVRVIGHDDAPTAAPSVATPRGAARLPAHAAVLCDLSTSAGGIVCNAASVTRAYERWMASDGAVEAGATFRVEVIGRARDGMRRRFDVVVPPVGPGERVAYVLAARSEATRIALVADASTGSAIAEALQLVTKQLHEKPGRGSVIILSDLRQVGGGWNFEVQVPPPALFTESLKRQGLVADLHDVPVLACIHDRSSPGAPPFDAKHARALEATWKHSFAAMGAADARILSDCEAALAVR